MRENKYAENTVFFLLYVAAAFVLNGFRLIVGCDAVSRSFLRFNFILLAIRRKRNEVTAWPRRCVGNGKLRHGLQ